MHPSVWHTISRLRQAREPLAWWKRFLGAGFESVRPFLAACEGVAGKTYPCPDSGLRLQIRETAGRYTAFPTGDDAEDAEDRDLTWEEVQAWRLDPAELRRRIAEALDLAAGPAGGAEDEVQFAGTCERGGSRKRVYLCHAEGNDAAVRLAADPGRTPEAGCLLFAERHVGAEQVLKARGVACLALAECVTLEPDCVKGRCNEACRSSALDMSNVELKAHLDRRLDKVGQQVGELERENRELKRDLAQVLANLARQVAPEFFQWIFVVLGTGSVSAAARELKIPSSTFADRLQEYVARGGLYKTLYSMTGVRKKSAGRKRVERFNELFDEHQGPQAIAEPGVLRELLDGLEALDGANWHAMREELIGIVRGELPEE